MKIVISGYFCTGKTSLLEKLKIDFGLQKPKTYTTRKMRRNELEGNPYTFIGKEAFENLRKEEKLFDPIHHAGNDYAVDRESLMNEENWVIDILPDSWEAFREIPNVVGIYLIPPSNSLLKERAKARHESVDSIEARILAIHPQDISTYPYAIHPQKTLELLYEAIRKIVASEL